MPKKKTSKQAAKPETFEFKAEASQLLRLMAHALYSNKEIFLRELIANASDAIDKLRFESVTKSVSLGEDAEFAIKVEFNEQDSTLTVSDNGIGMSRDEVIDHLGTIARSGTAKFLQALDDDEKADAQQIGQFGVGFYSVFVVADKVEVESLRADAKAGKGVRFISTGEDDFQIEDIKLAQRGTSVRLFMKQEEAGQFLNSMALREIIKKYADHLSVPVQMLKESALDVPEEGDDVDVKGEGVIDVEPEPEFETINQAKAIWMRPRQDVTKEEYEDFFRHLSRMASPPLGYAHNKVEGKLDYTSLLYVPKEPRHDIYDHQQASGLKLYVQRIFIMDDVEQFLPRYLRFVRGLLDTNDLPLNVSRELLQEDRRVVTIRAALTKRVLDLLTKLQKDEADGFDEFWQAYGAVLKEGVIDDMSNAEKLKPLLRFYTALSVPDAKPKSLQSYVDAMPAAQEQIYYLICDTTDVGRSNPHLEVFRAKGFDVLLCADPIDTWAMPQLGMFQEKSFQDVTRASLQLDDDKQDDASEDDSDSKAKDKDATATDTDFTALATALDGKVKAVTASKRLVESPSCLVLEEHDMNENMRKLVELTSGAAPPESVPTLELNPEHPLVLMTSDLEGDELEDVAMILYEQAILTEGRPLSQPADFVKRLNRVMLKLAG